MPWYQTLREKLTDVPPELVATVRRNKNNSVEVEFLGAPPLPFDETLWPPGFAVISSTEALAWAGNHGNVEIQWLGDGTLSVLSSAAGFTLLMSFEGLGLTYLSPNDLWSTFVPRIGDFLPQLPIKAEYLKYVEGVRSSPQRFGDGRPWELALRGGIRASLSQDVPAIENLIPNDKVQTLVAVWPPAIVPNWKLYLLCHQGIDLASGRFRDLVVWFGNASAKMNELTVRKQSWQHERDTRDFIALWLDQSATDEGPRLLQISGGNPEHCGFFQLLDREIKRESTARTFGVDFGSSNTVVATNSPEPGTIWGKSLDLKSGPLLEHRVIAVHGDSAKAGATNAPWIPSVNWTFDHSNSISQVPSGVLYAAKEHSVPFLDFSIVGPGFESFRVKRDLGLEWQPDLKWGTDEQHRECFLVALLIWAIAAGGAPRSVTIRASYPLAFSPNARKAYHRLLNSVVQKVSAFTGSEVKVAKNYFDDAEEAFVDESTPLLTGVFKEVTWSEVEVDSPPRAIMVADLGGGTLDLVLGYFNNEARFRVLAAESVRVGARVICELIGNQFSTASSERGVGLEAVESIARSGRLNDLFAHAFSETNDGSVLPGHALTWEGNSMRAVGEVLPKIGFYYLVIAEYCARFVAGVISGSEEALLRRLKVAPGSRQEPHLAYPIELLTLHTGNGWGFLTSVANDLSWRKVFESRVATLAPDQVRHLRNAPRVDKRLKASQKNLVAENIATMPGNISNLGHVGTVAAAPNGFDDKDIPWSTLVGPGSPVAGVLHNHQLAEPLTPAFPKGNTLFSAGWQHKGIETLDDWRRALEADLEQTPSDWLNHIQERQRAALVASQHHGRGRMLSAIRVVLETSFRQALGCEILEHELAVTRSRR